MKTAVERIRKQFENTSITFEDQTITATASFGIAGFRGTKPPDWNTLVTRADTSLYAAKHRDATECNSNETGYMNRTRTC